MVKIILIRTKPPLEMHNKYQRLLMTQDILYVASRAYNTVGKVEMPASATRSNSYSDCR